MTETNEPIGRKPPWLKRRVSACGTYQEVNRLLYNMGLHTVCEEARCPNLGECFSRRTATFLILGRRCTRDCRFCAVAHGPEAPPDPQEPKRVAEAAAALGLQFVVVTSVTRDDLPDGGACHFAEVIREVRRRLPDSRIEVLVPDFGGSLEALQRVLEAGPHVLNHNLETVPRLYPMVRPGADYERSLLLLQWAKELNADVPTKSGLMLGLGETDEEVKAVLGDLVSVGCSILTLGQYLQPSRKHLSVKRFVPPEEFALFRQKAISIGFREVASGPFVRSSYHAGDLYESLRRRSP